MQKLKSKISQILRVENKLEIIKDHLCSRPVLDYAVPALLSLTFLTLTLIRPLALLFLTLLCFWIYKTRCNKRIHTSVVLKERLEAWQQRVAEFRQARPAAFCIISCITLSILAAIGHVANGSVVALICLISAALISTRYNFNVIEVEERGVECLWPEQVPQEYEPDEEFMPEENETNMFVLERASDLASLTLSTEDAENDEDKSDEVPQDLLIPDSIPEIDENSTDDDQDDLLPIIPASESESHTKHFNPATDALVKYSQSSDTIEFKKSYFKRDSSLSTSSSSEESLSKGLQFPDHTAVDGPKKSVTSITDLELPPASSHQEANDLVAMAVNTQAQALLANSSKLIPSLMTGLVQGIMSVGSNALASQTDTAAHNPANKRVVTALDSSDESDFEMLEQEDFQ